jgi:protein gp37
MNRTKIPWADYSWNPATGCTPVSEGCDHCYAERVMRGYSGTYRGRIHERPAFSKVEAHPDRLDDPGKVRKPSRIFVCSMGDLFHPDVDDFFRARVWNRFSESPRHTFMVLTKRADRMETFLRGQSAFPNVWIGVTAENQARADERIPLLLKTPAARRFVSVEPILGRVDLTEYLDPKSNDFALFGERLDWVISGGESGPDARECREEWVQNVYDQCRAASVPFFFEQGGARWMRRLDGGLVQLWDWEKRREWPK